MRSGLRPLVAAGVVLGIGMGGFLDGILFHQILQLHNMFSQQLLPDTIIRLEINMFWDGIFHAVTWLATLAGLLLLWQTAKRAYVPKSNTALAGAMLLGWGAFNLVEGLINHQILQLHHVIQRASPEVQLLADLAFLMSGLFLIGVGGLMIRKAKRQVRLQMATVVGLGKAA
jgi:uncharacterized membrane protein